MDGPSYGRDMRNAMRVMAVLIFAVGLVFGLIFGLLIWAVV